MYNKAKCRVKWNGEGIEKNIKNKYGAGRHDQPKTIQWISG